MYVLSQWGFGWRFGDWDWDWGLGFNEKII